jgi:uncharacterized protein
LLFEIHAEKNALDKKVFLYDNETNVLKDLDGNVFKFPELVNPHEHPPATTFSKDDPLKKSKHIALLKIQLGLGCNYTCDYCSQKFVERAESTTHKDVESFLAKLDNLEFDERMGLKVEFWGGEPLVYWKTLKPLAEALKERFESWENKPQFSIITNGSILTEEIIDWLMMMDFQVSISHDGPGQSVRGPDPFDDPEKKKLILGFYRMMTRLKKGISFNSMLSKNNQSRKAIHDWFMNLTGNPNIVFGEGTLVDAYDEDGITNSLITHQDHFNFRRNTFKEIYANDGYIGFQAIIDKIDGFTRSVLSQAPSKYLGQKCGMDNEHTLAVDLKGNVITCQNVSAAETSKNGQPHLSGSLDDYENVSITTSTHWSNRAECPSCPVLHLCKGACMFLDNKFWEISCANAYSDNVTLFALSIQKMTGYIPTLIKNDALPLERQDVFGTMFKHEEKAVKRIIPIKVVSEVVDRIDDVEIYGKARVAA